MELTLEKNELSKADDKVIEKFTNELKNSLENNDLEETNQLEQYREGTTLLREYLGTSIGIPILTCDNEFKDILDELLKKGMNELSKSEETLYWLKSWSSKEKNGTTKYAVGEYKDGKFEGYQYLPKSKLPKFKEDEEIIFTYNKKGKIEVRDDLKEKLVENYSEDLQYLKEVELKRNENFKQEGYIYRAYKSKNEDNVILLKNIGKNAVIEDLDFSMNDYTQSGLYQVKDGKYVKISDDIMKSIDDEMEYRAKIKEKEKKENKVKAEGFNVEENLEKYNKYWSEHFTQIEDKIGQRLGLSPVEGIDNSIIEETLKETFMELAKSEKIDIYRCAFPETYSTTVSVTKYAKDRVKPKYTSIPTQDLPDGSKNDRIFVYNKDGSTTLREDLKEKAMENTAEKLKYLKEKENEELQEFKKEGYLYKYYIPEKMLLDLQTEDAIQDLDFAFNKEKGA